MNSKRLIEKSYCRQLLNKYLKKKINTMNKEELKYLAYCWNYYVKTPKFEKINGLFNYRYYIKKWRNKYYFELRK